MFTKLIKLYVWGLKTVFSVDADIPIVETAARMYFSYLYIPVMATVLVYLLNTALHCAYHLLVPLSGDGYWVLLTTVPPYIYGILVLVFLGYRLLTVMADTMVDCFYSQGPCQYVNLKRRLVLCLDQYPVFFWWVWTVVGASVLTWSTANLSSTALAIIAIEAIFITVTGLSFQLEKEKSSFFEEYWVWIVPKIRDISFGLISLNFVIDTLLADLPAASDFAVTTSTQLLLPHITLNLITVLTLAAGDLINSASWLYHNSAFFIDVTILMSAHMLWGMWAVVYIPSVDTAVMSAIALASHFVRATTVFETSTGRVPFVYAKNKAKVLSKLACDAYEIHLLKSLIGKPSDETGMERKQLKWRIRFRRLIRLMGGFGLSLILGLTIGSLGQGLITNGAADRASAVLLEDGNGGFAIKNIVSKIEFKNVSSPARGTRDEYPILCTREWAGLGAFELSYFSLSSYLNRTDFEKSLKYLNSYMSDSLTADWQLVTDQSSEGINSATFYEIYSPSRDLHVISIRGTNPLSFTDMLQDVSMYVEVGAYQILSHIFPFFGLFPKTLVASAIYVSSISDNLGLYDFVKRDKLQYYWEGVSEAVKVRQRQGSQVVLTGHSLGSAIGMIAGAHTGSLAVGFHGPGILLSHKKFGIPDEDTVHKIASNIIPDRDLVPLVDAQGGELHHIICRMSRHDACHLIEATMSGLWDACPSVRKRVRFPDVVVSMVNFT